MKIVKLTSENVKRLSVVEITPDGALVTIGGKNGAGKSSVLDSIAYVLGGEKLVPTQPIRSGQSEARIVVELDDLVVTRRFVRDYLPCDCGVTSPGDIPIAGDDQTHLDTCATRSGKFGPVKSTLIVANKEGARYPAPQVMLDKLYGRLTFDPLAFSKEKPPVQNEILRKLVNLDFTLINGQRKTAFDRRAMTKKTLTIAETKLNQLPQYKDVPTVEIPVDAVAAEIKKGNELGEIANEAIKAVDACQQNGQRLLTRVTDTTDQIEQLERDLRNAKQELASLNESLTANAIRYDALVKTAEEAKSVVPDFAALDTRLREVDATNRKVRDNQAYDVQHKEVERLGKSVAEDTALIAKHDITKESALQNAKFPVDGLGLTDEGVTFEGLPLQEVSASVQLRVSIAIGLALNPTLKVLLIRNGNLLDDDSLKMVAQQAEEAGAQVWMEYVTSSKEGVSVMLEDGHVA